MIAFAHNNPGGDFKKGTIAIDLPNRLLLDEMDVTNPVLSANGVDYEMPKTIKLEIGFSVCSKEDQFIKLSGRNLSSTRLKITECTLIEKELRSKENEHYVYHFCAKVRGKYKSEDINFGLSVIKHTDKVKLLYAYFSDY